MVVKVQPYAKTFLVSVAYFKFITTESRDGEYNVSYSENHAH